MTTITATQAKIRFSRLLDEVSQMHDPIQIKGKRSSAVLVSEEDWRSIQETLFLLSIPGMRKSIFKGLKIPLKKTSTKLK